MGTKSGKEVRRIMLENGRVVTETEGSHFQMIHPEHSELGKGTVPIHGHDNLKPGTGHDNLKPGTFANIKRKASLKF